MKAFGIRSLVLACAVLGISATQSHAVLGVGLHWAPALGYKVKSDAGTVDSNAGGYIRMNESGVTGLNGFGLKFWVDAIPLIDLEATTNFQYGYYNIDVITKQGAATPDTTSVSYNSPVPFLEGKPVYARVYGDLSILYPFLKLPPAITLLKVYAGGGITYGASTTVVSAAFAKKALTEDNYNTLTGTGSDGNHADEIIRHALRKDGFQTGFGGFAQLGAHVKPPIIPIALYVDFKYHFLGFSPELADENGLTMELGGAIAF